MFNSNNSSSSSRSSSIVVVVVVRFCDDIFGTIDGCVEWWMDE